MMKREPDCTPFRYHEELCLTIAGLDELGQGIAPERGVQVAVHGCLPGERVRAKVFRCREAEAVADLVEVLESSPSRVKPQCPLFGECGGCQFQHWAYEDQLGWKGERVETLLKEAGIEAGVLPPFPSPRTYGYRSKMTPHFEKPRGDASPAIGFLKRGRRSACVDVEQCPIATDAINQALRGVRQNVLERLESFRKGATLLLREAADGVETDPRATVREVFEGLELSFPAGSFFQNNPFILGDFVGYAMELAKGFGVSCLVDAYCGSGLFALSAAGHFGRVRGIEIDEKAVAQAAENARRNQLPNVEILAGRAEAIFDGIGFEGDDTVVLTDPPRKGCSGAFLEQLVKFSPVGVVYVSCNPVTQVRDMAWLQGHGYRVESVRLFDLFPQTRHLETIALLSRA